MASVIEILTNGSTLFQTQAGQFVWFYDSGYGGWDKMPVEDQQESEIITLLQDGKLKLGEPEYEYWGNETVRTVRVIND
jgi:hypothetical protein